MKALSLALSILGTALAFGQGSQGAFDFSANPAGKNHINMGNLPIGTSDFTVEFWYKSNPDAGDPAIFSNKDWNSGTNTGFNINFQSTGNVLKINIKGATGVRRDLTINGFNFTSGWNHIAITVNRADSMKCFLNGIRKGAVLISGSTGDLTSVHTYKLGQDGTGNYGNQVTGQMDEFRIWNTALTQVQIRDRMCTELTGLEPNLLVNYPFNATTGNNVQDITNTYNGTITNGSPTNWTTSGAYIGNESTYAYTNSWNGVNLGLNGSSGNISLNNIIGSHNGIQLYKIDAAPLNQGGISNLSATADYYGVFFIEPSGSSALLTLDYSSNTDAITNESSIILFERTANNSTPWIDATASVNTAANQLTNTITNSSEFILGYFNSICADPTNFTTSNTSYNDATLNWTSNAVQFELEYGTTGFTLGNGTTISTNNTNQIINGLNPGTSYDVYLTAQCVGSIFSNTIGPITFQTTSVPSSVGQGSGLAINNTTNTGFADLSNGKTSAASLQLPTQTITVEAWAKPRVFQKWDGIVSFIQDNSAFEKGWDLEVRDNNKFAFALSINGVLNYLETNSTFKTDQWYHITGTYDGTTQKIYINGQLEGSVARTGSIDYADTWLAVGSYKDDNESNTFEGEIDEVRIWNTARTAAQIQATMCHKLQGNESNLTHYYRFDEIGSTQCPNLTGITTAGNFNNLTISNKVPSGAPIGDTSTSIYNQPSWNGVQLTLPAENGHKATVTTIKGNEYGIHLYQINGTPDGDNGCDILNNLSTYYGVFVADNQQAAPGQFTLKWDYSGNAGALAAEANLKMVVKNSRIEPIWALDEYNANASLNFLISDTAILRKEFALADNILSSCSIPNTISSVDNSTSSATIFWNNGGSGTSNVQWGEAGFTLGTGTIVSNITTDSLLLNNLSATNTYEVYIQDSCAGGNSIWVGPFVYQPEVCELASNVVTVSITDTTATATWDQLNAQDWIISWGPTGLQPDWGITVPSTQNSYTWEGLSPNTTYEFYIKSNCTGASTTWAGPFTFTTTAIAGLESNTNLFLIYPNPFQETIVIVGDKHIEKIQLVDATGKQVSFSTTTQDNKMIIEGIQTSGVYFLTISTGDEQQTYKLIKN